MSPAPPVFAIILAAGSSRRFGDDKLVALLAGRTVLAHAIEAVQATEAGGTIRASYVVVPDAGGAAGRVARELGARIIAAPDGRQGMAWSLRAGLEAVRATAPSGPAAVLVVLGDQPLLRPEVIAALVRRWRATGAAIVRPRYALAPDAPGHPVLVDRSRWDDLAALTGDRGLGAAVGQPELVDVPGHNPDVDTRADLAALDHKEPP